MKKISKPIIIVIVILIYMARVMGQYYFIHKVNNMDKDDSAPQITLQDIKYLKTDGQIVKIDDYSRGPYVAEETCGEKHNYSISTKPDIENGIDSLALINILIKIEHVYGINIDEHIEEVAKAKTIGDIVELVRKFT